MDSTVLLAICEDDMLQLVRCKKCGYETDPLTYGYDENGRRRFTDMVGIEYEHCRCENCGCYILGLAYGLATPRPGRI